MMSRKFKDFGLGALFLAAAALFVVLIFLCLTHSNDTQKAYDELYDEYLDLSAEYNESKLSLDNLYHDIGETMNSMSDLYLYFEEQSISFDEAYASYEELSKILHPYY